MGVLDKYVQEIVDKPHHLTPDNIFKLRTAIPVTEEEFEETLDGSPDVSLKKVLARLSKTAEVMFQKAQTDKNVDDLKIAAGILKQVMDVAIRYTDKINAADRAQRVETALVDAVNSYGDEEFKQLFMEHLKTELGVQ